MQTVILEYLLSNQILLNDTDYNAVSSSGWVRFNSSFEHARLLSRDLQASSPLEYILIISDIT